MSEKRHILSIQVDNEPGVLSRIVGLFSGRGYNIESLNVAATNEPDISRITMVTTADTAIMEQIKKQLHKLINVVTVHDLTESDYVQRELALIKIHTKADNRSELINIVDIFRYKIVDVGTDHVTIQATATEEKLKAFIELVTPMGIKEIVRTGSIALYRGS
ncbi:acetolactate synthase small subunit [Desulfoluna limicola]|uniref:Acetolactate synthase small subunit n=1 Tax=Desulfoluna limicola TaxID=2810562 RepID=A0ABN6F1N0_9BACT|nr:acetolactate synthase small subunit [Desulfoluna limicola]BCS96439.1 acetolactate synthase small subunit [Desulfoluna limicola]